MWLRILSCVFYNRTIAMILILYIFVVHINYRTSFASINWCWMFMWNEMDALTMCSEKNKNIRFIIDFEVSALTDHSISYPWLTAAFPINL